MTERQAFEANEQREDIFRDFAYLCGVCWNPVRRYGKQQLAHRIAQTEDNIKKYGADVIHHRMNLVPVCCLRCNDACNTGMKTKQADELAALIVAEIEREKKEAGI